MPTPSSDARESFQGQHAAGPCCAWTAALEQHPDPGFVRYVLQGIKEGFRIGYDYSSHTPTSSTRNLLSTLQHPAEVETYLQWEPGDGNISEVTKPAGMLGLHVSVVALIPCGSIQREGEQCQ